MLAFPVEQRLLRGQKRCGASARSAFPPRYSLELQGRANPQYSGILQGSSCQRPRRIGGTSAWMDDVLKIWLQRPTVSYLILIDRGQKSFKISRRPVCID